MARLKISERKLAYSIFSLEPDDVVSRNKLAQKLLDVAQGYQEEARSYEDARVVQEAADALVRGEPNVALKLLGMPKTAVAEVGASSRETWLQIRELLDSARGDVAGVHNGMFNADHLISAAKSALAAATLADRIGAKDAAAALSRVRDRASDDTFDYEATKRELDAAKEFVSRALGDAKAREGAKR